jgi:zinc transport system permease protein
MLAAIVADTPVGSTIVAVDIAAFLICQAIAAVKGGILR